MKMDYMLSAGVAALTNIGLLGAIVATYIQNMRLIRSYFTGGLIIVASLFIIQNVVIVIFWSKLYVAGPSIKGIVDASCSLLVCDKCGTICRPRYPALDKQKVDPTNFNVIHR